MSTIQAIQRVRGRRKLFPPPQTVIRSRRVRGFQERAGVLQPTCLPDFGGVGDRTTSNTAALRRAVEHTVRLGKERGGGGGGAQLNIPGGRWVTGSLQSQK
ncbi:hypothetical protein RHGRI_010016 [Rhododendron griersonianum]|uniref:Uncharacterized protein n=1 Tax=Rhododendron griersonianum TaxID=479676 RepID=A0AAV6KI45_9ERIC|nr:hypothetical protein RHGRI_010016 [Rhododendron griersonianum]